MNNDDNKKGARIHNAMLYGRNHLVLSGVSRVDNFNESVIVLVTELGMLTVEGDGLHINKLSLETGDMSIEGRVTGFFYTDDTDGGKKAKGMFSKIFK